MGQIPEQAGCHPFQLGLCAAAVPPCPTPSQHGRICLRLIRRRQDSQGRTSECSDASAAVVELNFLISSIPLRRQESGPLRSGLSHGPPYFYLIKCASITEPPVATGASMLISCLGISSDAAKMTHYILYSLKGRPCSHGLLHNL